MDCSMKVEPSETAVRVLSEAAISSLGEHLDEHMDALRNGRSGIRELREPDLSASPFFGGMLDRESLDRESRAGSEAYPLFERFCIGAARQAIDESGIDPADPSIVFVIATTKGNIDLLKKDASDTFQGREYLAEAGKKVSGYWGNPNEPWVLSNACISGVQAIDFAADLLRVGHYERAVVIGGDILSAFTVSGFQAFLALASGPCKPYDQDRDGLNLGEGAGSVVLKKEEGRAEGELYVGMGASSNDANHISGPSRTGEGLASAIERCFEMNGKDASMIDQLNAHGTATPYNDEMEAKAFEREGLERVPMNSYKGAFGHCLGAAGIIESSILFACMRNGEELPCIGHSQHGVSRDLNTIRSHRHVELSTCLKTASGFGGCNAALIFEKG